MGVSKFGEACEAWPSAAWLGGDVGVLRVFGGVSGFQNGGTKKHTKTKGDFNKSNRSANSKQIMIN